MFAGEKNNKKKKPVPGTGEAIMDSPGIQG